MINIAYWGLDKMAGPKAQIKENIKASRCWPLCGEFTDDRWIPRKKAINSENVSIWWRHHDFDCRLWTKLSCLHTCQNERDAIYITRVLIPKIKGKSWKG